MKGERKPLVPGGLYGKWKVIEVDPVRGSRGSIKYLCICTPCGKTFSVYKHIIVKGRSSQCRSCARKEQRAQKYMLREGERFGKWEVIKFDSRPRSIKYKGFKFICLCHECGKKWSVMGSQLRRGKSTYCRPCNLGKQQEENVNWRGYGKISRTTFFFIQKGAETRGLEFRVTIQELWELYESQGGLCALTKQPISFGSYRYDNITASLDRINSEYGYYIGNVQWVHKDINMMKLDYGQDEFIEWCRKVADANPRRQENGQENPVSA